MTPQITFCGAAGTVTGSCFLIERGERRFLVDCGMFQGAKTLKELNYKPFPFDPRQIEFVLLTHAHIDHSGLGPRLIKEGFSGPVIATQGTRDLLAFMWPDSGHIHEFEVQHLNRRLEQRGKDLVQPIYTKTEAIKAVESVEIVDYETWLEPASGVRVRYWNAGHILGSASIEIELAQDANEDPIRLLFSGDIGPEHKQFHPDPDGPDGVDYLICESTYGGRSRKEMAAADRRAALADVVNEALRGGQGVLVIPAFSVERTQELLSDLDSLLTTGDIGAPLVFLDSPLAIEATKTFAAHVDALEDVDGRTPFSHENFVFTQEVDESKRINNFTSNVIIIAASGMCDAGRIRHHLKRRLWRKDATILMVGYQAEGTLGSLLLRGKKNIRIQGEPIKVEASIKEFEAYSAHADAESLVEWVSDRMPIREGVFLTHGAPDALRSFRENLVKAGLDPDRIVIPELDEKFALGRGGMRADRTAVRRLGEDASVGLDWHNDLAQLSLDIRDALEGVADERSRQVILRRLRRALENQE